MSYFLPGLWHFAAAMAWAVALGVLQDGNPLSLLGHIAFTFALLVGSSALFFVPEKLAKKGLMKFLHYPLPDWDVLLLGPASHRNWLTHSPLLPFLLAFLTWKFPFLIPPDSTTAMLAAGLSVGIGSHLFWDCVGSREHKIIVVPYWFSMRQAPSRVWLLMGAAACLGTAVNFGILPQAGLWAQDFMKALELGDRYFAANPESQTSEPDTTAISRVHRANRSKISAHASLKPRLIAQGTSPPQSMAIAWGGELFVTDATGKIMRVAGNQLLPWLGTSKAGNGSKPGGTEFHNGVLYICNSGRRQILAVDSRKRVQVVASPVMGAGLISPKDCAVATDSTLYYTAHAEDERASGVYFFPSRGKSIGIQKVEPTTESEEEPTFTAGLQSPGGIALSKDGKAVFVAETGRNRIWRYPRKLDGTAGPSRIWCVLPPGGPRTVLGPRGIALDAHNRLFVAHSGMGVIQVVSKEGKIVATLDAGGQNPTDVAITPDSRTLYVSESETKAIYALDLTSLR